MASPAPSSSTTGSLMDVDLPFAPIPPLLRSAALPHMPVLQMPGPPSPPAPSTPSTPSSGSGGGGTPPPPRGGPRGTVAPGRPRRSARRVYYDITYSVRGTAAGDARGAPAAATPPADAEETKRDRERLLAQFQLVAEALRPLLASPALRADKGRDVEFLRRFTRGDFFRTVDVEASYRRAVQTVPAAAPADALKTFEFEVVGGTDADRYAHVLRKLAQVWEYESRQWRRVFAERSSRGVDLRSIEDIILDQELVLTDAFVGTEALLTAARDYAGKSDADPAVDKPTALAVIDSYVQGAREVLLAERGLIVQKLTEGALLKGAFRETAEALAVLRRDQLRR